MPQSFKEWAKIINQGKFKIKPKNLKFGTVYVAGRLGNSWGGMTIVKIVIIFSHFLDLKSVHL